MSIRNADEPGVEMSIQSGFHTEIFIVPRSEKQRKKLEAEVNHECATILPVSHFNSTISNRPKDGEIVIDLRQGERDENYYCYPSWWEACVYDQ